MATDDRRGPVSGWFEHLVRSWIYYQADRRRDPATSTIPERPEPDDRVERAARRVGWMLAVIAPLLTCGALVALREDIGRSTAALVLVLPVVLVAVLGGPGPAALTAVVASLAFDVFLTRPYHRLQIHAAEDIEATLILLSVGLVVGQLVAREARGRVRSTARGTELEALLSMVAVAVRGDEEAQLAERAVAALRELLHLRDCQWLPGYHGAAHPRLTPSGDIAGGPVTTSPATTSERTPLPATGVELEVSAGAHEFGRLILVPSPEAPTSREELLVAVAIADLFGLALTRSHQP